MISVDIMCNGQVLATWPQVWAPPQVGDVISLEQPSGSVYDYTVKQVIWNAKVGVGFPQMVHVVVE